ncbi:outer membrane protein [Bacteroides reticulotermitis JCM 10512]|uniref:Outer membrane protein n=1 Tax=Bacteroides reticulotermitis JCM 10512 TaxID=1445607 RepID=W4UMV9_9BACE|nr:outer membrane protein [Bacteroides reticulotermitis JCM 10512]
MKIYKLLFLGLGLTTMSSCSDFLDQTSPSELDNGATFDNTYYTELALNKVYGSLTQDQTYSNFMPIIAGTNTDCELIDGLGADASNTSSERGNMNYNMNPGWAQIAKVWDAMYGVIENANLVVDGVNKSQLLQQGGSTRNTMLRFQAEAKTLRAMVYFDLVRLFGDIPFKTESSNSNLSNVYIGKTDRDAIMDSLIVDLKEAIAYLPWAGVDGYTTEHVTKGYAHGLLANIAMTRAGYVIREQAKEGYVNGQNSDPNYPTQRCSDEKRKELYQLAEKHLVAVISSGKHQLNSSVEEYWRLMNISNWIKLIRKTYLKFRWV